MSFKIYNSSCHVSYICVYVFVPNVIDPVILFYTQGRTGKVIFKVKII